LRWTQEQYINHLVKARSKLPHAQPERDQATALVFPVQGEAEGIRRIVVRFTGYRVRPLDPDNFAGSVKDLLDGLRHAGIIPGDEHWRIKLETEQVKVSHYKEEKTVIEVE
jgi:hypothetical protein